MKRFSCILMACFAACVAPEPARSPRSASTQPVESETIEAQARSAAKASAPRKEHRALNLFVGSWETVVVDVSESGVESDARPGRATIEWIFGGRYLRWDAVLELGGETHATTGYLGYDVNQAEYQLLMISDLATGMGVAHGRGEPNSKGITLTLEIVDPRSGALQRARSVLRVLGADHFVLEQMAGDGSGGERVARRTHYRRS